MKKEENVVNETNVKVRKMLAECILLGTATGGLLGLAVSNTYGMAFIVYGILIGLLSGIIIGSFFEKNVKD